MEPLLLDRVAGTISRYNMWPHGCRVAVAVSGGADSVFLLHALRELAPRWNVSLSVIHLNHGLRLNDSDADEKFVGALATELGLQFTAGRVRLDASGPNLEDAGRRARKDFFSGQILAKSADRVATGHTRSDQAETVLYRLMRGAGTTGLRGVLPFVEPGIVRPLLDCERGEIETWLRARGLPWREDRSNLDLRFVRNRIRHQLLPLLAREYNRRIVSVLSATAELALEEEEFWRVYAAACEDSVFTAGAGEVLLNCEGLNRLPAALARRVVRLAIERAKGSLAQIGFEHVEELLKLAKEPSPESRATEIPGLRAVRSLGSVALRRTGDTPDYSFKLAIPGVADLPSGARISLEIIENGRDAGLDRGYNGSVTDLDCDRFEGPFTLRNWRAGDSLMRAGGPAKLKDLFQEARIPSWERQTWPVLVAGGKVVWTRRFGAAVDVKPREGSRRMLRVTEVRNLRDDESKARWSASE